MADELSAPLGRRKGKNTGPRQRGRFHLPLARIVFAVVALVLVGIVLRIVLVSDPQGGRPSAEVAINSTRGANPVAGQVSNNDKANTATITAEPETPAPAAITPATATDLTTLPGGQQGVRPELAEETKNGPIPRISAKGETPFSAYARPAPTGATAGKATVAIVVTGLGLNEAGTLDAINKLPPEVSMAFAPYGKTLNHTVSAAQGAGHELLLEVPLEPFDYPDTDPGPQTLLTGQPPKANLDKLYWLMARFGGYIGLVNHTGARFTASAADFGPVMEELGTRGLGYLDDGSSNRSLAPQLAASNKVPFSRADVMLDANPARGPILAALDALVAKAQAGGSAVGVISALPISIQTVADWATTLETHNVTLVPVSTLMK